MKNITLTLDVEAFAASIVDHPRFASAIELAVQRATTRFSTKDPTDDGEYLNMDQAAKFLGLAKPTLYEKTSNRQIPFLKAGGKKLLFKRSELIKWLESGRRKTKSEIEAEAENDVRFTNKRR